MEKLFNPFCLLNRVNRVDRVSGIGRVMLVIGVIGVLISLEATSLAAASDAPSYECYRVAACLPNGRITCRVLKSYSEPCAQSSTPDCDHPVAGALPRCHPSDVGQSPAVGSASGPGSASNSGSGSSGLKVAAKRAPEGFHCDAFMLKSACCKISFTSLSSLFATARMIPLL